MRRHEKGVKQDMDHASRDKMEALGKCLAAYAAAAGAAGVGLLATAQPASADIVYTPANTVILPGDPADLVPIDFNHDGIADFQFKNYRTLLFSDFDKLSFSALQPGNGVLGAYLSGRGFPARLKAGAAIGGIRRFNKGGLMAYLAPGVTGGSGGYWGRSLGTCCVDFINDYLGVEFIIAGQEHFG